MKRVTPHSAGLVLLALGMQLALATSALAATPPATGPASDYIVVLKDTAEVKGETALLERNLGFRSKFRYTAAIRGFAARLTPNQIERLQRHPLVQSVSPDGTAYAVDTALIAGGENVPTGVRRIGASTSVVAHSAAGVNVAVIDTGIDLNHPDLSGSVANGTNCITPGASAMDDHGHGTHVAGTIGARNIGTGVIGVAPGTLIYAVKVLNSQGSGQWSQIICGIDWVKNNSASLNIKVANMSLGGGGSNTPNCGNSSFFFGADPLHQALCAATAAGVTFVVAAGNGDASGNGVNLSGFRPAAYPEVLTVTAVADSDGLGGGVGGGLSCRSNPDDRYATFSNYATSSADMNHTIAAPGVCIMSTTMGGGYAGNWSGTSMASPHAAGAVALCIKSGATNGPCAGLTPAQVIQKMREIALNHTTAVPSDGFTGLAGRYYGSMVWAGNDLGGGTPTPNFSLIPSPAGNTVTQGGGANYTVSVNPSGGFNGTVTLSVSGGLPAGVTATPSGPSASSFSLSVTTTAATPVGTHTINLSGTSGALTRTTSVSLTVNAAATPNFSLIPSPAGNTVTQGGGANYTVSVNPSGGFNGTVTLSVSGGLPAGVTATPSGPSASSFSLSVTTTAATPVGSHTINLSGTSGALTRTTSVSLTVNAAATPNFSLIPSPAGNTVTQGGGANYTVSVNPSGGFNGTVTLSVSGGLPAGVTATPSGPSASSFSLSVTTTAATPVGTHTINLSGTSGALTRTTSVSLTVNAAATPNFSLIPSPAGNTVTQGGGANYTVSVNPSGGFNGTVTLSVSGGLPAGVTATPSGPSASSFSLSVTTTAATPVGTHTINLSGTSGALTRTTSVSLTVNAAATPNFSLIPSPAGNTVTQGGGANYTVSVNPSGGFNGTVTLSVSGGLPAGVTATPSGPSASSFSLSVTTTAATPVGTHTINLSGTSGALTRTTSVSLTVNASTGLPPSFTLVASPTFRSVQRGITATYDISVQPSDGFGSAVSFSVSGLGSWMSATFTPTSTTSLTTLRVNSSPWFSPRGTRILTITGTGGGISRTVQVTLNLT